MATLFDSNDFAPTKPKTRYRIYTVRDISDEKQVRKDAIRASNHFKPHKRRAIQRARDSKYDETRGDEEPIDMFDEELNSALSSRVARPFTVVHMDNDARPPTAVVVRGTAYEGNTPEEDITVIHEMMGWTHRTILQGDFAKIHNEIYSAVKVYKGSYNTFFA